MGGQAVKRYIATIHQAMYQYDTWEGRSQRSPPWARHHDRVRRGRLSVRARPWDRSRTGRPSRGESLVTSVPASALRGRMDRCNRRAARTGVIRARQAVWDKPFATKKAATGRWVDHITTGRSSTGHVSQTSPHPSTRASEGAPQREPGITHRPSRCRPGRPAGPRLVPPAPGPQEAPAGRDVTAQADLAPHRHRPHLAADPARRCDGDDHGRVLPVVPGAPTRPTCEPIRLRRFCTPTAR